MTLHTGHKPIFFRDQNGYLPYPKELPPAALPDDFRISSPELATSWTVISSFCSTINLSSAAHGRIPWVLLYSTMTSVMYRLIDMQFQVESLDEALRLGLLAFCSRTFLQGQTGKMDHRDLSRKQMLSLRYLGSSPDFPWQLQIWLLMIVCISNTDHEDNNRAICELRSKLCHNKIASWTVLREILQSLLWIPVVFDQGARRLFDEVLKQRHR